MIPKSGIRFSDKIMAGKTGKATLGFVARGRRGNSPTGKKATTSRNKAGVAFLRG